MKKYLLIASALMAVAAVSGCSDITEMKSGDAPGLIHFTASIGRDTKATDTSFEEGDKVGLYAGEPLNLVNIPLEYDNGALKGAQALYWAAGQTGKVSFRAYYPYFEEIESQPEVVPFIVKKDQSKHEDFTKSDLMFATAEGSPSDKSVNLVFDHLLSKLVLEIDNQSGDPVAQVMMGGPLCGSLVNRITGEVGAATANPDSGEEDVIYRPLIETSGTKTQCSLILPPQKTIVEVLVITAGGHTFGFGAKQTEFLSGKTLKGSVTLHEIPVGEDVEFTLSVTDWAYGGTVSFSDKELGVRTGWNIVYYPSMGVRTERIPMEEKAPGSFYGQIEDYKSFYQEAKSGYIPFADRFILVSEHDGYSVGCRLDAPQDLYEMDEWPVSNGGLFRLNHYDAEIQGPLGVWFYPDEGMVRLEPKEPKWKKLGTGQFVNTFFSWHPAYAKACDVQIFEDENRPGVYKVLLPSDVWDDSSAHGPDQFVVDARDPEKVILRPMVFYPDWEYYEVFYSAVPGNRGDGNGYGTLKDGVIRLGNFDSQSTDVHTTGQNEADVMQIVLPGYRREPLIGYNFYDMDSWESDGEQYYALIEVRPWLDLEGLRYCLYRGHLDYNTLYGEVKEAMAAGDGTPLEFTPGEALYLYVPVSESGSYTLVFYGEPTTQGSLFYYTYNTFYLPDESVPEGGISLTDAKPHALFPDKAATVHFSFPDGYNYRIRAVSAAAAAEYGLAESDYYDYAMAGTSLAYWSSFYNSVDGQDVALVGLEPETEYIIIAAGTDVFKRNFFTSTTVTTEASPASWTTLSGTATIYDNEVVLPSDGPYTGTAQIRQADGTQRYRLVQPFAPFWEAGGYAEEDYLGSSTDLEFCLKEVDGVSYIYYLPFMSGYMYAPLAKEGTKNGWVTFMYYDLAVNDPSKHIYTAANKALADGVYNIAPYGYVEGTTGYYNYMMWQGDLTVTMPGASAAPSAAPAPVPAGERMVKGDDTPAPAVIFGENKVAPFERKPLPTAKTIVRPVKNNK